MKGKDSEKNSGSFWFSAIRFCVGALVLLALLSGGALVFVNVLAGHDAVVEPENKNDSVSYHQDESVGAHNDSAQPIRILFIGDLMFDRGIRQIAQRLGYEVFVEAIVELASEADIVVGNLEGIITNHTSKSIMTSVEDGSDHFTFTFEPIIATLLASSGVSVVSLANNHALDFGPEGVAQTRQNLQDAGIAFFGDPLLPEHHAYTVSHGNRSVAFIGYNQFGMPNETDTLHAIELARHENDFVVVMSHWGEEYTAHVTETQRRLAYAFIDAGADAVVGAHPHVIQPSERYRDGIIYYSLGNAVFDQWFSTEVSCGLALLLTVGFEQATTVFIERYLFSTSRGVSVVDKCPETI